MTVLEKSPSNLDGREDTISFLDVKQSYDLSLIHTSRDTHTETFTHSHNHRDRATLRKTDRETEAHKHK